jgi:hypothetical protein
VHAGEYHKNVHNNYINNYTLSKLVNTASIFVQCTDCFQIDAVCINNSKLMQRYHGLVDDITVSVRYVGPIVQKMADATTAKDGKILKNVHMKLCLVYIQSP